MAEIVREEFPEAFLSVSSEVLPQYREYERFSTVALNAYVGPRWPRTCAGSRTSCARLGVRTGLHLMTSASGVVTAQGAVERPVNLLMSGPVAGVVGGIWVGRQAGFENVITLDVGGTSADIGLAQGGTLRMKHLLDTRVGPYQAMIPMVDVDTIGAGGGSIAYVDGGGIFRSGPRSAGAVPGPAAYGRGGTEPTSTDAMVNLGWLAAGELPRRRAWSSSPSWRARRSSRVAETLGHDRSRRRRWAPSRSPATRWSSRSRRTRCARASTRATSRWSPRAARDRRSPRRIAVEVGTPAVDRAARTRASPRPSGLLATDAVYEYVATTYQRLSELNADEMEKRFDGARGPGTAISWQQDGIAEDRQVIQRVADCRYLGQGYELRVECPSGAIDDAWVAKITADFHDAHEREYSRRFEDSDIEIPNIRVRGVGLMPPLEMPEIEQDETIARTPCASERKAWFQVDGRAAELDTKFYARESLKAGNRIEGPAVIDQYDSTTVVPPGLVSEIDRFGNIVIWIDESSARHAPGRRRRDGRLVNFETGDARCQSPTTR